MILAAFSSLLILMHAAACDNTVVVFVNKILFMFLAIGFFGPVNFHTIVSI